MDEERCETCRYWIAAEDNFGDCRRFPPVYIGRDYDEVQRVDGFDWPATYSCDQCGEWSPRKPLPVVEK